MAGVRHAMEYEEQPIVSRGEPVVHQLLGGTCGLPPGEVLRLGKIDISVLLRLDNTSAVCYINKLGETVSSRLKAIVRDLWLWRMNRGITPTAEHLPGVLNMVANEESWVMKDHSDWKLNPRIFNRFQQVSQGLTF